MAFVTKNFKEYDKKILIDSISGIDISRENELVVTKYFGVTKAITRVSSRYEIFDIKNFMIQKIDAIEENFKIHRYKLRINRGQQSLVLISDPIEVGGLNFYKSFYILNSSDRSRRLSLHMGLMNDNDGSYAIWGIKNMSFFKKHLTGITENADQASQSISGETFDEQIESLRSIVGQKVMLSKVRDIIVDEDSQINHRKFDAFKNTLISEASGLTASNLNLLRTPSEKIEINSENDFSIDAFLVFGLYMRIFRNQDSHIVRKETERIMSITQWFIRNEKLKSLLMEF